MAAEKVIRLVVLIDTDNAQPSVANALLAEIAKYGTAFVKRAYGDWTAHQFQRLEGPTPHAVYPAYPAVLLYPGQEHHGFGHDN